MYKYIFTVVLITTSFILGLETGSHYEYYNGFGDGIDVALDTCNKIILEQIKSDTSVSHLVMVCPDTNVYFLSRKTILIK